MNYEPAQVAQLDKAEGFICGWKYVIDTWDCQTGDYGSIYVIALDDGDE